MRIRRPRLRSRRARAGLVVGVVLGAAALAAVGPGLAVTDAAPIEATATGPAFVTRSGADLQVAGAPWRFTGYNLPCAQPFVLSEDELGFYLDNVRQSSGTNVLRAWFFQSNGGPGNWAPFDRVVAAVKARGMKVVPTLTDQWHGACDTGAGTEKTANWYTDRYKQPDVGHALAYRDYATQVAARYAGEPAVAMWQLVNEAQALTRLPSGQLACDNTAGQQALRSFADDMAGSIKAVDPNHLVNLGTLGGSQCGLAGSAAYKYVHAGAVDVCEFHDYGSSAVAMPAGPDLLAQRINDCATLPSGPKPLFIGEAGIQGNVQPNGGPAACTPWPGCTGIPVTPESLVRRAQLFEAKIAAAFSAGVDGYVIWVKSPYYSSTRDIYAIGDGDPTEAALKGAATGSPGPPPPTITEVLPCNASALLRWRPADGAPAPAGYDITASNGVTASVPGTATSAVVKGLPNGRAVTFTMAARGASGLGEASAPSASVVPRRSARCGTHSLAGLWSRFTGR